MQLRFKVLVEVCQQIHPVLFALFHLVQAAFHISGKLHIDDVLEPVHHQSCDHLTQGGRDQMLVLLFHILPVLNGGDGGGVGGGAANALFFHRLYQGGLGKPGGGLGKVLLLIDFGGRGFLPYLQFRQRGTHRLRFLIPALFINGNKAGEPEALVCGPEHMPRALGIDRYGIIDGICHLACQEPAPDQLVELILVQGQAGLHPLRVQLHVGGPDGFMGILGPGLGLVNMEFAVIVFLAVAGPNEIGSRGHSLVT